MLADLSASTLLSFEQPAASKTKPWPDFWLSFYSAFTAVSAVPPSVEEHRHKEQPRGQDGHSERSTHTHTAPSHTRHCCWSCCGFLESVGRSLEQGNGTRMRKREGPLALYSRALSGCHGGRGLLPEPLCEMRTLQKHSLERDRKSTGDCSDRSAVKVPSLKRQCLYLR